ncbi:cuticle protein 18.7 [Schistocerca cancellata]|uniref:cuticle protein 18.7 n=1 Tax=Schistocerca cancellata TaxID=274614 RepID=UPI00211999BC|nr:cuticle protein 18.7 [Schistocerca cancellata]
MKVLIVVSALVAACLAKPGYLSLPADTPEVAAAKVAHFAAYHEAAARSAGVVAVAPSYGYAAYGPANIVIGADGVPLDTPEVAARKAADAVAHARAAAGLPAVGPVPVPAAVVPAAVGSVPADTPEVAAAKVAHAAAHVEANVRNAAEAVGIHGLYGVVPSVYSYGVVPGAYSVHHDGTLLTPEGVPLDTPAVAAGKVANAVAHIRAKSGIIV